MDIAQAKTFLAVVELRNFNKAAKRLSVTQSTVSARIKTLEEQLECVLFIRNKAGVTLTDSATKFQRHAQSIVQLWEYSKKEIIRNQVAAQSLTIGARFGLWEPLLLDWLMHIRSELPNTVINARIGTATSLIQKIHNGTMDICLVYTPYTYTGLKLKKLFDENFVMVSSEPRTSTVHDDDYVYVHWGSEFARKHKLYFPDFSFSKLSANLGALAQNLITKAGLIGYLPYRTVSNDVENGRLYIVKDMPIITLPVFMIYSELIEAHTLKTITESLDQHCKVLSEPSLS